MDSEGRTTVENDAGHLRFVTSTLNTFVMRKGAASTGLISKIVQ